MISPWWNLDAAYLDVSESYRETLIDFKNNFYPGLAQGNAQAAVRGEGVALSVATLSDTVPGAQYHFTLHDPEGLIAAAIGPGFKATIDLGLADAVLTGQDWLEAGDRVCSINAICDEFFYDGQLLFTPYRRASSPAVQVEEMVTPWDDYIDSATVRAGVRLNAAVQDSNNWRNLRAFAAETAVP